LFCLSAGISIDAPASILFRWLCKLRVAPYSYDWIGNHLTIHLRNPSFFPSLAISYVSAPVDEHSSRLIVKAVIQGEGLQGLLFRPWFAPADLVMMKKQLKTLKSLAEESATLA